jgi:hypothetical protein
MYKKSTIEDTFTFNGALHIKYQEIINDVLILTF